MTDILALIDFETTGLPPFEDQFPVEIGILFLREDDLSIVGAVDTLIRFDQFEEHKHLGAFQVNNLKLNDLAKAPSPLRVVQSILKVMEKFRGNVRLCSDNIVFDEGFMRRLWHLASVEHGEQVKWPFHYNSDDLRLLFRETSIERTKVTHRAMADVGGNYTKLIEARRRISR